MSQNVPECPAQFKTHFKCAALVPRVPPIRPYAANHPFGRQFNRLGVIPASLSNSEIGIHSTCPSMQLTIPPRESVRPLPCRLVSPSSGRLQPSFQNPPPFVSSTSQKTTS